MNHAEPKRNTRYNPPGQAPEGFLARQSDDLPKGRLWTVQRDRTLYAMLRMTAVDVPQKVLGKVARFDTDGARQGRYRGDGQGCLPRQKSKRKRQRGMRMHQHRQAPARSPPDAVKGRQKSSDTR